MCRQTTKRDGANFSRIEEQPPGIACFPKQEQPPEIACSPKRAQPPGIAYSLKQEQPPEIACFPKQTVVQSVREICNSRRRPVTREGNIQSQAASCYLINYGSSISHILIKNRNSILETQVHC